MSTYLSCTATSVQPGHKRFPNRHDRPEIKSWRCDLTALSRSHNFYFVACNDTIHVYQPRFPGQLIPSQPDLTLNPPTSSPFLQPGIDHEDSHSITRLHVDYLGQEEIILITCDDGDVIGYRTEEIQRVVDRERERDEDLDALGLEEPVRTFLHRNVGASAWGLAIHREARMIAISANTHKVTVIAYALTQPDDVSDCSTSSSGSELGDCSEEEDAQDFPSPRRQDHVIVLPARHNVPSVSFNNSGDDPSGRWLSSCSINGETLIWDLHSPDKPVRTIRLGFCASVKDPTKAPQLAPGSCACLRPSNFPHAVWSTMFLDATTAYENPALQDSVIPSNRPLPYIKDVSKEKNRFSVRRIDYYALVAEKFVQEEQSDEMDVSESESVASDESESLSMASSNLTTYQSADEEMIAPSSSAGTDERQDQEEISTEDVDVDTDNESITDNVPVSYMQSIQPNGTTTNTFADQWFDPSSPNFAGPFDDDDDDDDDTDTDDDGLFALSTTEIHMAYSGMIQLARAYCEVITAFTLARQPKITSPLLIVTKEDVYLYQRPLDYVGDQCDYIISIRHPLHPDNHARPHPFPFVTGSHDRHCYTTQIPELGVFIIASPNGRAGIFSLTRAPHHSPSRPQFSFQLEFVLPFANSDKTKIVDVEGARLIGVAAGPIQGTLDRVDGYRKGCREGVGGFEERAGSRRWRILMYYTDHTVLSFEVSKRREGEVPEFGGLVV